MNRNEYKHKHYVENKDRYKDNHKRWLDKNRKYYKKYKDKWYRDNTVRLRDYRISLKNDVYDHYGRYCKCCGELNELFLSVDHVNNDGNKERRGSGGHSTTLYTKIIKEGFPDTYQILCYNCNLGKSRNGGICPHEVQTN